MDQPISNTQEQFTRLLVANQRRLYGFIFTLIQDHSATDDVLQESTTLLWEKFDSFQAGTDFGAWAMKVARFKVLEWRRKQQKLPLPIEEELLLELASKAEEAQVTQDLGRREALEHCLTKLSERDSNLLNLRYGEGQSVSFMADNLGRTRDAVYKVLARIHRDLQTCIRGKLNDELEVLS
ncbi:MAG: sigma-70 family RNA polymerase sigma factor [Verrucomicrobiota bacterium]